MRKLVRNRVNIFDKLAFGISFIPFLCFCTMFTYYFNQGLIVNSSDISRDGMYYVIKTLLYDFFTDFSIFFIFILLLRQINEKERKLMILDYLFFHVYYG